MPPKPLARTPKSEKVRPAASRGVPSLDRAPKLPLVAQTVQRALKDPASVTPQDVLALQRTLGNCAVQQLTRSLATTTRVVPVAPVSSIAGAKHSKIQRTPIDKEAVIGQLAQEPKGMKALKTLDRVRVYEVDGLKFLGDRVGAYAITYPYEKPPVILLNEPAIASDEVGAITLYHESKHAFDPDTPSQDDNSQKAMLQDFANEAKVLRKEAKHALRMGGKALNDALSTNIVKQTKLGGYKVNEKYLTAVGSGKSGYGDYAKVSRSTRFNRNNYKYTTRRDLSWDWTPRPGIVTPFSKLKKGTDVSIPFDSLKKGTDVSIPFDSLKKGTDVSVPFDSLKKGTDTTLTFDEMRNQGNSS
jgi:hypothetical protein